MAGGPIPTNLQDMIQLISADKLQEDLFSLHAPDLHINWASLSTKRKHRAEQLAKLLTDFMRTDAGKGQGMHLFRQISTIAIINADASNAASISDQIDAHIELKNRINDVEWLSIPKKGPAILASFVNILAHREPKPTGDEMKDKHNNKAREVAKGVWQDLVSSATSQLNNVKHTARACVTAPTVVGEQERAAGISDFCTEIKRLIREKRNQDKFYVAVAPVPCERHTRYLIKTSPLAGEVMAVNEDHSDTNPEPNRHVIALEILHDEMHNRICISKTAILPQMTILRAFMKLALGCEFEARQKLSYAHCLQPFRGKAGGQAVTLPEENVRRGDRAWIASMSISLDGNLLPTTYRGDELQDIYQQMDRQIDAGQFPEEKRIVEEIVFKVKLHDTRDDGNGKKLACSDAKTFTIKAADNSFTVIGKDKCFQPDWLNILDNIQKDWGFEGCTMDQAILGTDTTDDLFTGV